MIFKLFLMMLKASPKPDKGPVNKLLESILWIIVKDHLVSDTDISVAFTSINAEGKPMKYGQQAYELRRRTILSWSKIADKH